LAVAVDSTSVYWSETNFADAGAIVTCPSGGCDGGPTVLANAIQPEFIAIDATNVYWTDWTAGNVMMCAKTGCGGTLTMLASGQKNPIGIAHDSTTVYWANNSGTNGLMKCDIATCADGGSPTVLYASALGAGGIALDSTNIYVTVPGGTPGAIVKFPKDVDAGFTLLANTEKAPIFIATDGINVYWTNDTTTSNNVRKCSVDGCCLNPTTIAPIQNGPFGIAVDTSNVYWINNTGGTAMQLTPK
jgi:hypothetical protein